MNLTDLLSGSVISSIAGQTSTSEKDTQNVLANALPALVGAMAQNASTEDGANSLAKALDDHTSSKGLASLLQNVDTEDGAKILTKILGGETETVQNAVAKKSGASKVDTSKILAMAAPLLLAALGSQKKKTKTQSDGLGGLLTSLLGGGDDDEDDGSTLISLAGSLLGGSNKKSGKSDSGDILTSLAGGLLTTHFEFKYLHDTLLKLDELGHDMPTFYKYFEEYTGIPIDSIPMNDPKVYSLLTSPEALGVTPEQIDSQTGTFGIPEMGTNFVRGMLVEARPKNFSELIQISGLSHGTDVWTGNADELIRSGTCTIAEVIGCRDSIMLYLLRKGLEPKMAFDIMEAVRKGKVAKGGFKDGWEEAMREHEVPDWYIESCRKIKYMFPKAHAVAYLMSAIRLMWFKIYRPPEFYAVYFTVRGDDIDYEAAVGGAAVARAHMEEVKRRLKEEKNAKDEDVLVSLQLVNEMLVRGYEFLPIELGKSRGSKYVVEDGKVRLPFSSLKGLGGAAADALEKVTIHGEEYISVEELQQASGVGSSILDRLRQVGALGDLPESSQVSFF